MFLILLWRHLISMPILVPLLNAETRPLSFCPPAPEGYSSHIQQLHLPPKPNASSAKLACLTSVPGQHHRAKGLAATADRYHLSIWKGGCGCWASQMEMIGAASGTTFAHHDFEGATNPPVFVISGGCAHCMSIGTRTRPGVAGDAWNSPGW